MINTFPDADQTVGKLRPITDLAWGGLEYGTLQARDYFREKKLAFDPYAASMVTRLHARRYIDWQAKIIGLDVVRAKIPNIGLRLSYLGYWLWIMKAYDDDVPSPGWSDVKQRFFNQLPLPFPTLQIVGGNVILLWDATKDYRLIGLTLVCPKSIGDTRDSFESHWEVPLEHPADLVVPEAIAAEGEADAVNVDDLDEIKLKPQEKIQGDGDTDE